MAYNATNPNGQTTGANSAPVVIASDQSTLKVKLTNDLGNATGTITSASSVVATGSLTGIGSATISIYGTYAGVNLTFEGADSTGTNWVTMPALPVGSISPTPITSTGVLASNATLMWNISPILGMQYVRVRATAWTSGTANIIIAPSAQFTQPIVSIGSGSVTLNNDSSSTGSLNSLNASVTTASLTGASSATIQVSGTWVGTLTPQASIDGVNYIALGATGLININTNAYSSTIPSAATGMWQTDISAFNYFRISMTSYTSGPAVVTIKTSEATGLIALDAPIPTGTNSIGNVTLNTGSNTIGNVNAIMTGTSNIVGLNPTNNVTGLLISGSQSIQSLSNTVTVVRNATTRLYEYDIYNPNTSAVWVQLFNSSTSGGVTLGTTAPIRTIYIPASSGRDWTSPYSLGFVTGLAVACTTTNVGSTAPASPIQAYFGVI